MSCRNNKNNFKKWNSKNHKPKASSYASKSPRTGSHFSSERCLFCVPTEEKSLTNLSVENSFYFRSCSASRQLAVRNDWMSPSVRLELNLLKIETVCYRGICRGHSCKKTGWIYDYIRIIRNTKFILCNTARSNKSLAQRQLANPICCKHIHGGAVLFGVFPLSKPLLRKPIPLRLIRW